jgi:hypothetical protein
LFLELRTIAGIDSHIAARSVSLRVTDSSFSATGKAKAWVPDTAMPQGDAISPIQMGPDSRMTFLGFFRSQSVNLANREEAMLRL